MFVPKTTNASADHDDFKCPHYFRGHLENYYNMNYIPSWSQKRVRRCEDEKGAAEALFLFSLMMRAGFGDKAFDLCFSIATEDVGPGCRCAFELVAAQYERFLAAIKQIEPKQHRKTSRAVKSPEAVRILLETVLALAQMHKSRLVACAAGVSFVWTEALKQQATDVGSGDWSATEWTCKLPAGLDPCLQMGARVECLTSDKKQKDTSLGTVVSIYDKAPSDNRDFYACGVSKASGYCGVWPASSLKFKGTLHPLIQRWMIALVAGCVPTSGFVGLDESKRPSSELDSDGLPWRLREQLAWSNIVYLAATQQSAILAREDLNIVLRAIAAEDIRPTIKALTTLYPKMGSDRQRFFACVLMLVWPEPWKKHGVQTAAEMLAETRTKGAALLDTAQHKALAPMGRDYGVPLWALDKHTAAGKAAAKGRAEKKTPSETLYAEAQRRGELDDVKTWSADEIAKSHRVADFAGMNAIEHFFDVGAVVKRAVDNPLHALCREAYLGFFRKHKQNFRVTKTEYMGKEQWCSWLAEALGVRAADEEAKKSDDAMDVSSDEQEEKKTKGHSGKSSLSALSKAAAKKRKRDSSDDDEDEVEATPAKKKSKTPKRDQKTNKSKGKPTNSKEEKTKEKDPVLDRTLPGDFPKQLQFAGSLDAKLLGAIRALPLAQMVCGKGSLFDANKPASKPPTYMDDGWVFKGPYDVSKDGANLKVRLMQYRTDFAARMGCCTPAMSVWTQADNQDYAWVRFKQLAPVQKDKWRVYKREHSESGGVEIPIVDSSTTGVVQCSAMEPDLWFQYPALLAEMMVCNCFKLVTQPVAGDVHLGNLVSVAPRLPSSDDPDWSRAHVYALDLEDHRTTFPTVGAGALVLEWWQYAFNRRLETSKLKAINKALVAHRSTVLAALQAALARIDKTISAAQLQRAQAFIQAVEAVT